MFCEGAPRRFGQGRGQRAWGRLRQRRATPASPRLAPPCPRALLARARTARSLPTPTPQPPPPTPPAYIVFSIGLIKPLQAAMFPECFKTHEACSYEEVRARRGWGVGRRGRGRALAPGRRASARGAPATPLLPAKHPTLHPRYPPRPTPPPPRPRPTSSTSFRSPASSWACWCSARWGTSSAAAGAGVGAARVGPGRPEDWRRKRRRLERAGAVAA
jgi:hypothetical protein